MQNKIILLEGPDASGKTTLANILIQKYKANYIHMGDMSKRTDSYEALNNILLSALMLVETTRAPMILDRHWISMLVYGSVYDDASTYQRELDALQRLLDEMKFEAVITDTVICLPERDIHKQNFERLKTERVELYDSMEKVYDVYERELKLALEPDSDSFIRKAVGINKLHHFDFTKQSAEDFIENLMNQ